MVQVKPTKHLHSFIGRMHIWHFYSHKSHVCRPCLCLHPIYQPISWKITFSCWKSSNIWIFLKSIRCIRNTFLLFFLFFRRRAFACVALRLQHADWMSKSTFSLHAKKKDNHSVCSWFTFDVVLFVSSTSSPPLSSLLLCDRFWRILHCVRQTLSKRFIF